MMWRHYSIVIKRTGFGGGVKEGKYETSVIPSTIKYILKKRERTGFGVRPESALKFTCSSKSQTLSLYFTSLKQK